MGKNKRIMIKSASKRTLIIVHANNSMIKTVPGSM